MNRGVRQLKNGLKHIKVDTWGVEILLYVAKTYLHLKEDFSASHGCPDVKFICLKKNQIWKNQIWNWKHSGQEKEEERQNPESPRRWERESGEREGEVRRVEDEDDGCVDTPSGLCFPAFLFQFYAAFLALIKDAFAPRLVFFFVIVIFFLLLKQGYFYSKVQTKREEERLNSKLSMLKKKITIAISISDSIY